MPEVKLNAADAAELPRCCNSSANGWPETPARAERPRHPATHGGSGIDGGGLSYSPAA